MGVGCGLYMYDHYDVVVKRSRSLSHLLMSSCLSFAAVDLSYNSAIFYIYATITWNTNEM